MPSLRLSVPLLIAAVLSLTLLSPLPAQTPADQAAEQLLNNARRAYNEKNYPFAADRFREFLTKFGKHKEVPSAR